MVLSIEISQVVVLAPSRMHQVPWEQTVLSWGLNFYYTIQYCCILLLGAKTPFFTYAVKKDPNSDMLLSLAKEVVAFICALYYSCHKASTQYVFLHYSMCLSQRRHSSLVLLGMSAFWKSQNVSMTRRTRQLMIPFLPALYVFFISSSI